MSTSAPTFQKRLQPVGRCIYCGAADGLTDEHVIPVSLGGNLILPKASCPRCQEPTKQFEQVAARGMYWPLRLRLGIIGNRRRKTRPTHWPIEIVDEGGNTEETMIEIGKLPLVYLVPRFPPPSHLTGRPHVEGSPEIKLDLMAEDDDLKRLHEELGAKNSELSLVFEWAAFSKLIAKVAHAHAVGVLGLDGVEFYLPRMIVGDHTFISKFVGGCSDPQYELPPSTDLALALIKHGNDVLVVVRTTFFGADRFPVYEAVVGRVTDVALISRRLKAQSSGHS